MQDSFDTSIIVPNIKQGNECSENNSDIELEELKNQLKQDIEQSSCFSDINKVRSIIEGYNMLFILEPSALNSNVNIKKIEEDIRNIFLKQLIKLPDLISDNQINNIIKIFDIFYPIISKILKYKKS